MKLLVNKVLKEKFNSFKVEQTILVYIIPGRRIQAFKDGSVRIAITDIVDRADRKVEAGLKKSERKEQLELKKKHNPTGPPKLLSQKSKNSQKSEVQPEVKINDTRPLVERVLEQQRLKPELVLDNDLK